MDGWAPAADILIKKAGTCSETCSHLCGFKEEPESSPESPGGPSLHGWLVPALLKGRSAVGCVGSFANSGGLMDRWMELLCEGEGSIKA